MSLGGVGYTMVLKYRRFSKPLDYSGILGRFKGDTKKDVTGAVISIVRDQRPPLSNTSQVLDFLRSSQRLSAPFLVCVFLINEEVCLYRIATFAIAISVSRVSFQLPMRSTGAWK